MVISCSISQTFLTCENVLFLMSYLLTSSKTVLPGQHYRKWRHPALCFRVLGKSCWGWNGLTLSVQIVGVRAHHQVEGSSVHWTVSLQGLEGFLNTESKFRSAFQLKKWFREDSDTCITLISAMTLLRSVSCLFTASGLDKTTWPLRRKVSFLKAVRILLQMQHHSPLDSGISRNSGILISSSSQRWFRSSWPLPDQYYFPFH